MKDYISEECCEGLSHLEKAYRRGYHQGFVVGRNQPDVTEQEVRYWRHSDDNTCPPGSMMEGVKRDFKRPLDQLLSDLPLQKDEFDSMGEYKPIVDS